MWRGPACKPKWIQFLCPLFFMPELLTRRSVEAVKRRKKIVSTKKSRAGERTNKRNCDAAPVEAEPKSENKVKQTKWGKPKTTWSEKTSKAKSNVAKWQTKRKKNKMNEQNVLTAFIYWNHKRKQMNEWGGLDGQWHVVAPGGGFEKNRGRNRVEVNTSMWKPAPRMREVAYEAKTFVLNLELRAWCAQRQWDNLSVPATLRWHCRMVVQNTFCSNFYFFFVV